MSGSFSGKLLEQARLEAGLSREELAASVSRTAQTVYLWERGKKTPRPHVVAGLARILGVEVSALTSQNRTGPSGN